MGETTTFYCVSPNMTLNTSVCQSQCEVLCPYASPKNAYARQHKEMQDRHVPSAAAVADRPEPEESEPEPEESEKEGRPPRPTSKPEDLVCKEHMNCHLEE